jgi:uroporphyrinogen-III synthase
VGIRPLEGLTVAVTADRRADEQAQLLAQRGARVLLGPTIRTLPHAEDERVRAATEELIRRPPDVLIANTGVGMRSWLALAESFGPAESLLDALGGARILSRGPKASGVLTTVGLRVDWQAPSARMDEVVEQVIGGDVAGRRVALQLDGGDDEERIGGRLRAAGAEVVPVSVYRWTLPDDVGPALRVVEATRTGRVDAVTFTAAPAVRNLFALAEQEGVVDEVRDAFNGPVLAMCVGPVCVEAAAEMGVTAAEQPRHARLGAMVQTLTELLCERRRVVRVGDVDVVLQGSMILVEGRRVLLPDRERLVFAALAERHGAVVPKRSLLATVWGGHANAHALEMAVARLRKRLEPTGLGVETVVRRGYRLVASAR